MLDGSTVNDLFESIGLKVLDMWDSEHPTSSFLPNQSNLNNTVNLEKIIDTPSNKLGSNWVSQLRSIIDEMEPTDFAIYGKRLCLFLLQHIDQQNDDKLNTTVEPPISMTFGGQNSTSYIPIKAKPKKAKSPKSKHIRTPRSKMVNNNSFQSNLYNFNESTLASTPQKAVYPRFPEWLPNMKNQQ